MQLRCRRASDTFMYLNRVFGYLHGISKCRLLLYRVFGYLHGISKCRSLLYRVFGYLHGISKCRSLLLFAIPLSILWPRTDEYLCVFGYLKYGISKCQWAIPEGIFVLYLWEILASIYWYSNYLKVVNFEIPISGAFEHPLPVILYIGIYSQRKMDER